MSRALVFIAGVMLAGAAAAQYKWTDRDGRVQYGDAPPPGVNAAPMRRGAAPALPQAEASDKQAEASDKKDDAKKGPLTTAERDAEFRKRQQDAEKNRQKQAKSEREAADKLENCSRARDSVRTLESGRVTRTDSKGERYFLDDNQLAQETVKARQDVKDWCN
jgi:hypothetical protein